jgi:hypothetical protein
MIQAQDRSLGQRHRIRNAELFKHAADNGNKTAIAGSGTCFSHQVLPSRLAAHGSQNRSSVVRATPHHIGRGPGAGASGSGPVEISMPLSFPFALEWACRQAAGRQRRARRGGGGAVLRWR